MISKENNKLAAEEQAIRNKYLASMVKYSLELKKIGICDAFLQLDRDELSQNKEIREELKIIEKMLNEYLVLGAKETLNANFPNYTDYRALVLNKNFLDELNVRVGKGEIKPEQLQEIIKRYETKRIG